jgi:hypothetical protein
MNTSVNVQASIITTVKTITSFNVRVQQLELFKSVSLIVMLFDTDGIVIDTKFMTLEGQDYLAWNNDDQYILNYVANKLNLTLSSSSS